MKKSDSNNRKSLGLQKPGVIIPAPAALINMPKGYASFLKNLKERIIRERLKTVLSANTTMIMLYWEIGQSILSRQQSEGWGAKIIDRLSHDLKTAFPDMSGFSPRNLKYMRKFAQAWPDKEIVQRTVAQIPWRSNLTLLDKLDDPERMDILFEVLVLTINENLTNIFKSCELRESATVRKFRIVQTGSSAIGQQLVAQLPWFHIVAISKNLPKEFRSSFPSIEEIEAKLRGENGV
jgi:predicted nuclease of restriction endonuclease-like (RecB) superfamily